MNAEFYDCKIVSDSIESFCKEKKIKEADFAGIVSLHTVQLSRIKGGKSSSYEALCKIAIAVGKDVKSFLKPIPLSLVKAVENNLAVKN